MTMSPSAAAVYMFPGSSPASRAGSRSGVWVDPSALQSPAMASAGSCALANGAAKGGSRGRGSRCGGRAEESPAVSLRGGMGGASGCESL